MGESFEILICFAIGLVFGGLLMENINMTPIEDKLSAYCEDIGSTLKEYDRHDELVCENGATFTYEK